MKKFFVIFLFICMALSAVSFAEEGQEAQEPAETGYAPRTFTITGSVVAGESKPIFAPFGGIVGAVHVKAGDIVTASEPLFTIETTKVYAPCDGTIGSLRAQVGDDVAAVESRYTALLYIDPSSVFTIETDTTYAYGNAENHIIHPGETVYIGSRNSSSRLGMGFVTSVESDKYTVEVTGGNLILGDNVSIFRTSDMTVESKIGSGTTARNSLVPITADGSLFALHVKQGDTVIKGDLLLETVSGGLDYNAYPTNQVVSGYQAIVSAVNVSVGDKAEKNQTMAVLYPTQSLRVEVNASESDLRNIRIGDTVSIECSGLYDAQLIPGTVLSVSGLSVDVDGQPHFPVTIAFDSPKDIRIGMSAIAYFNQ